MLMSSSTAHQSHIWNDHSDTMSMRDCGWIQLHAESNQEAVDLHIQAYRLAEELSIPVMVCVDGFILTHAYEKIDLPTQEQVDAFVPPFEPVQMLDVKDPVSIGAMVGPEAHTEVRYLLHHKHLRAIDKIRSISTDFRASQSINFDLVFNSIAGPCFEVIMTIQPVKFYQTGTFTVGNRLLDENLRAIQSGTDRNNSLDSGHRACQGCGDPWQSSTPNPPRSHRGPGSSVVDVKAVRPRARRLRRRRYTANPRRCVLRGA
jgi:hypothetical protein